MSTQSTVLMFGSDGQVHAVPKEKLSDALKANAQLAVKMVGPDNKVRYIPHNIVSTAMAHGMKLYHASATGLDDVPPVPAPPNAILEQNPGNKVPFKSPGIVRGGVDFIPSIIGQTAGAIGGIGAAALGSSVPVAGTAAGGFIGHTVGAAAGGALGKEASSEINHLIFGDAPASGKDIGWEAAKQSMYEMGGQLAGPIIRGAASKLRAIDGVADTPVVGKVLDRLAGASVPSTKKGVEIAGVHIPETASQIHEGNRFLNQATHYIAGSWLGGKIIGVREAQEKASNFILGKLSGVANFDPLTLSKNWQDASQATRSMADGMYDAMREVPVPQTTKAAKDLLSDPELADILARNTKVRSAVENIAMRNVPEEVAATSEANITRPTSITQTDWDSIGKNLGYPDAKSAIKAIPQVFRDIVNATPEAKAAVASATEAAADHATVGDAIKARSALSHLAWDTTGDSSRAERKVLFQAAHKLDSAIDSGLTPEQLAVKRRADLLLRRHYIMQDFSNNLFEHIERGQASVEPTADSHTAELSAPYTKIIPQAFQKMVNDLAHASTPYTKTTDLQAMFDKPEDAQALKNLANFLSRKYSSLAGVTGITERIAALGLLYAGARAPVEALQDKPEKATQTIAMLSGVALLAAVLADPGLGPRAVQRYLSVPEDSKELATMGPRIIGAVAGPKIKDWVHSAINGDGHQVVSKDGQTWYDPNTGQPAQTQASQQAVQ